MSELNNNYWRDYRSANMRHLSDSVKKRLIALYISMGHILSLKRFLYAFIWLPSWLIFLKLLFVKSLYFSTTQRLSDELLSHRHVWSPDKCDQDTSLPHHPRAHQAHLEGYKIQVLWKHPISERSILVSPSSRVPSSLTQNTSTIADHHSRQHCIAQQNPSKHASHMQLNSAVVQDPRFESQYKLTGSLQVRACPMHSNRRVTNNTAFSCCKNWAKP